MNDFQRLATPPSQATRSNTTIACGTIAAAFCTVIRPDDIETGNIRFQEVLTVGGKLYKAWAKNKGTTNDDFVELIDLLTAIPEYGPYLRQSKKEVFIVSGNVYENPTETVTSPLAIPEELNAISITSASYVSLADAIDTYMLPGDAGVLVHRRYSFSLLKSHTHLYLYDSHTCGANIRQSFAKTSEVWRCPVSGEAFVRWMASPAGSLRIIAHLPGGNLIKDAEDKRMSVQWAAENQYSLSIIKTRQSAAAAAAQLQAPVTLGSSESGGGKERGGGGGGGGGGGSSSSSTAATATTNGNGFMFSHVPVSFR